MTRSTLRRALVAVALTGAALTGPAGLARAQDAPAVAAASAGTLTQTSEAEFVLAPSSGVSFTADSGPALTDGSTTEALPTTTTDSTGATVQLSYVQEADGLHIRVIDPAKTATATDGVAARGALQCFLGTGGGAGGGALGGGAAGSAIPGLGTAAGAIIGGISGAATGAAASCF